MVNKNSDQSEPVKFLYILITRIQVNDNDNHLHKNCLSAKFIQMIIIINTIF